MYIIPPQNTGIMHSSLEHGLGVLVRAVAMGTHLWAFMGAWDPSIYYLHSSQGDGRLRDTSHGDTISRNPSRGKENVSS